MITEPVVKKIRKILHHGLDMKHFPKLFVKEFHFYLYNGKLCPNEHLQKTQCSKNSFSAIAAHSQ